MKRKNTVLIIGAIRNELVFLKTLENLLYLRSEGCIERIFLSTWVGEISEEIRSFLIKHDIDFIETIEPNHIQDRWGHYHHQMRSIHEGLNAIDNDSFVFKTRTDTLFENADDIRYILDQDLTISSSVLNPVYKHKIWVSYFEIACPFLICDYFFYGHHEDIYKTVNFESFVEHKSVYELNRCAKKSSSEIRFWSYPFSKNYKIIHEFIRNMEFIGMNTDKRIPILNHMIKSSFYWQMIAVYYYVIHSHFVVGGKNLSGSVQLVRNWNGISDILKSPYSHPLINDYEIKNDDFLDNFFNSKFCENFFSFCSDDGWLKNIFEHRIKERFFQNNFGRFFMSGMTWSNSKKERELSKKFYKEIEERFFIT